MTARRYVRGVVPCTGCGRLTRAKTAPADRHPDTVVRYSRGMCWPCYSEDMTPTSVDRPDEAAIREAFEAYIRARRNRGVPVEGTPVRSVA
jgi:hypothetical protein